MALNILTPSVIWGDYKVKGTAEAEVVSENIDGKIKRNELFIHGEDCSDGFVKIYAELIRAKKDKKSPAVMIIKDFDGTEDTELTDFLVKEGYAVLIVDVFGHYKANGKYTVYPESMNYANYDKINNLYGNFESDDKVCWFAWVKSARYALKYLLSQDFVTRVGGLSYGEIATVLWQVAATDPKLNSAVFIENFGWRLYHGVDKAIHNDPQFSDEELAVVADIEPQSYAAHVKCPSLILCSTNNPNTDIDRAYDTVARISDRIYKAIDYSFRTQSVSKKALENINSFFEKFLKEKDIEIPKELHAKVEVDDGKIVCEANLKSANPQSVDFIIAEGDVPSRYRTYYSYRGEDVKDGTRYRFNFTPHTDSGVVSLFARATYENGFTVSSDIVRLKYDESEVTKLLKMGIIYTSRDKDYKKIFIPAKETFTSSRINLHGTNTVSLKKGPLDMEGLACTNGLMSFELYDEFNKPKDDSMLLLDVYMETDGEFSVNLISDYFGEKTTYTVTYSLKGVNIWHNIKVEISDLKTREGMPIRNISKLEALSFTSEVPFVINNVLWV